MTHSEICPVCGGKGTVPMNNPSGWTPVTTSGEPPQKTCHGCSGRGWVEVNDMPYYLPQPDYYPPYVTIHYNGYWDSTKHQWVDGKTTIHWHSDVGRCYD
jgi:hypothetical protein